MAEQEFVAEWLRYAEMDLTTAIFDFENMYPAPLEIICYHCQQAAEKFLKAVIVSFDKEVEKTHDLSKLLNVLEGFVPVSVDMRQLAVSLTQLATKTRYPETIFIDETITKNAVEHAKQIKEWAENIITEQMKIEIQNVIEFAVIGHQVVIIIRKDQCQR